LRDGPGSSLGESRDAFPGAAVSDRGGSRNANCGGRQ